MGFIGENGAGKTTSFYMIVGLIKPNEGRIFLEHDDGHTDELTKLPVYKRAQLGVSYLAQEASVFRHLSVEDNIKNTYLNPISFLYEEPINLLKQEVMPS